MSGRALLLVGIGFGLVLAGGGHMAIRKLCPHGCEITVRQLPTPLPAQEPQP